MEFLYPLDYLFNDHVWRVREAQPVNVALSKMMNQQSLSSLIRTQQLQIALLEELERLKQLSVIRDLRLEEDASTALFLDTRIVKDWRFQDDPGRWVRRSRMVAREFKTTEGTHETFSPTTPLPAIKTLLVLSL